MTKSTAETKSPRVPTTRVRRIVWSVVCACAVFCGFVAYAFLAATTYQATTEVSLQIPTGLENSLHPIADRRHRLTKAILGPDSLKQLGQELGVTKPDERLELANQLSTGVSITTNDGQTFRIVCTNAAALRAQQLCQGLARMAAARLPEAAMLREGPEERVRREKLERLLDFLAQHPELSNAKEQAAGDASPPGSTAQRDPKGNPAEPAPHKDALLNALTQQRRVAIAELNQLERVDPKNPYSGGLKQEVDKAHKRLAAIDAALATRRKGLDGTQEQDAGSKLDSKVMARLTEHLNQLPVRDAGPSWKSSLKASVTEEARLPSSPIVPDRTRLLILGALASLGVAILGLGFAFAARARPEATRSTSSYPNADVPPGDRPLVMAAQPMQGVPGHGASDYGVPAQGGAGYGLPVQGSAYREAAAYANNGAVHGHRAHGMPAHAIPYALPAPGDSVQPADDANPGVAIQLVSSPPPRESANPVNLTTTQVMDDPAPAVRPEAQTTPRTQLGGFELTPRIREKNAEEQVVHETVAQEQSAAAKPAHEEPAQEKPAQDKPVRSDNPISVKTVVALEANVSGEEDVEEEAPQTLLGGSQAPEPEAPVQQPKYTPPKRNITRRLGSLSWLDQAELSRTPAQPVSTRYSYVSSRPPPPDAANGAGFSAPAVIDVPGEGDEPPFAPRAAPPLTRRHPVPAGWNLPADLMAFSTPELAVTVSEGWRSGCIIVGVTARFELSRIKANVAASLAFRLGEYAPRVLLMEGDFQDPKVHRIVRVEMPISGGVSQQLQLRLARRSARDHVWEVMECHPTVDVLAEGFIRSPGGILSQQFEECLNDLRNCYDLIIIDGPPTSTGSEAQAFADLVDGVVVCTPHDRPDVQGLADSLFRNQRFIVPFPLRV